jgi:hypothetical protein
MTPQAETTPFIAWGFLRFAHESWKYTRGGSRLYFLRRLPRAWVTFRRTQQEDAATWR